MFPQKVESDLLREGFLSDLQLVQSGGRNTDVLVASSGLGMIPVLSLGSKGKTDRILLRSFWLLEISVPSPRCLSNTT